MYQHITSYQKLKKITFFKPVTLTFDLWPWPLNLSEIPSRLVALPNFGSLRQTVQPWERWQTDRHAHRRDRFYTLDRYAGGKNTDESPFIWPFIVSLWGFSDILHVLTWIILETGASSENHELFQWFTMTFITGAQLLIIAIGLLYVWQGGVTGWSGPVWGLYMCDRLEWQDGVGPYRVSICMTGWSDRMEWVIIGLLYEWQFGVTGWSGPVWGFYMRDRLEWVLRGLLYAWPVGLTEWSGSLQWVFCMRDRLE